MPITLYRADSRPPEAINEAGGFTPRAKALAPTENDPDPSLTHARRIAKTVIGPKNEIDLPPGVFGGLKASVENAAKKEKTVSILDTVRAVKAEKGAGTMHISTDMSETCGGYANARNGGNRNTIYKIEIPTPLFHVFEHRYNDRAEKLQFDGADGGTETFEEGKATTMRPWLIMDAADPDEATMIAVVGPGGGTEVSFLTRVPYDWVTQYREPDLLAEKSGQFKDWQDMPASRAQARDQPEAQVLAPQARHAYEAEDHPYKPLLDQAKRGVEALGTGSPHNSSPETQLQASVALVHAARRADIDSIDQVLSNPEGTRLFAIQGEAGGENMKRSGVEAQDREKAPVSVGDASADMGQRGEEQQQKSTARTH